MRAVVLLLSTLLLPVAALCSAEEIEWGLLSMKGYTEKPGTTHIIQNMPPPTSQQGFPNCYAHSAAAILNFYVCQQENIDCTTAPTSKLASPLYLSKYGQFLDSDEDEDYQADHLFDGGNPSRVVVDSLYGYGHAASQECVTEDSLFQELSTIQNIPTEDQRKAQEDKLQKLKAFYKKYSFPSDCWECRANPNAGAELAKIHKLPEGVRIESALRKDNFEQFLYKIVVSDSPLKRSCRAANTVYFEYYKKMDFVEFPLKGKANFTTSIAKIKEAIFANNPVIIGDYCVFKYPGKPCDDAQRHTLVAYGYTELCEGDECYPALKLRNSWGAEWEEKYGYPKWYQAKTLLDSTRYNPGFLFWLQPKADAQ